VLNQHTIRHEGKFPRVLNNDSASKTSLSSTTADSNYIPPQFPEVKIKIISSTWSNYTIFIGKHSERKLYVILFFNVLKPKWRAQIILAVKADSETTLILKSAWHTITYLWQSRKSAYKIPPHVICTRKLHARTTKLLSLKPISFTVLFPPFASSYISSSLLLFHNLFSKLLLLLSFYFHIHYLLLPF
jgi:hypothetical protein